MARVFVSYRRADGAYGVGWLAERLRSLDSITGVETAFHDEALRAGDDFPDALEREIASADLMVVIIGCEWLGKRDGMWRIQDPDDWVVREIATAFEQGTRVIPVLVDGAEHPLASEVHESIAPIARIHALPFVDGRELDVLVEHIESHLDELDRERARTAGLEEPVEVPKLERPWAVGLVAAALATIFATVLALVTFFRAEDSPCDPLGTGGTCVQDTRAYAWLGAIMIVFGIVAGITATVGTVLARRLIGSSDVRWRPLIGAITLAGSTLVLFTIASGSGHYALPDVTGMAAPHLRFWINGAITAVAAVGVALCLLVPVFSDPKAPPHLVGERVRHLAITRDAERWGAALLAVLFAVVAAAGAALLLAFRESDVVDSEPSPLPSIVFSLVFSTILLTGHLWALSRLQREELDIDEQLRDLPPRLRDNARPRLIARSFDVDGWGFRIFLALPLIVSLVTSAIAVTI